MDSWRRSSRRRWRSFVAPPRSSVLTFWNSSRRTISAASRALGTDGRGGASFVTRDRLRHFASPFVFKDLTMLTVNKVYRTVAA